MNMTIGSHGTRPPESGGVGQGEGSATRRRILNIALTLMSQRGVDGTSMRDLASAAELNVASLYHYFPSKKELLEAVLVEQGVMPLQAPRSESNGEAPEDTLEHLLADIFVTMFEVQDFVRLMIGESMRGESTARTVGLDLVTSFDAHIQEWVVQNRPDLVERSGAPEVARLLTATLVGVFVLYATGVLDEEGPDLTALALRRAQEAADILRPPE
jgi:AcrR family transcriptional regulator